MQNFKIVSFVCLFGKQDTAGDLGGLLEEWRGWRALISPASGFLCDAMIIWVSRMASPQDSRGSLISYQLPKNIRLQARRPLTKYM